MRRPAKPKPWICHATPTAKGAECGYFNADGGFVVNMVGGILCRGCGCTKKTSDDRLAIKQASDKERRQKPARKART